MPERTYRRLRWLSLLVALSYILGGAVAAYAIKLSGDVAYTKAARKAEIASTYTQCVQSVPALERFNRFFAAEQILAKTLLENAINTHKITLPGSVLYRQQARNLTKLRAAVADASGVTLPRTTMADCAARRDAALDGRPL